MNWLQREIAEGLQRLIACRLPGAPAADSVEATLAVWYSALRIKRFSPTEDAPRIREAFVRLSAGCDRWPAPKKLLDDLPPRPEPRALPKPAPDYEAGRANIKKLRSMLAGINLAMPIHEKRAIRENRVPGDDDAPFDEDACTCRAKGTCPVCLGWAERMV